MRERESGGGRGREMFVMDKLGLVNYFDKGLPLWSDKWCRAAPCWSRAAAAGMCDITLQRRF